MRIPLATLCCAAAAALAAAPGTAAAGVKIGVLSDMSGLNADLGGKGSVVAVQMAIEEFGGKVLGEPIELVQADMQSKPDISATVARRWYENDGVDVIVDINNSTAAIAVNKLAEQFKKIDIVTQAATTRLTREDCTPYSFHYGWDLFSIAVGAARGLVREGGKTWYFVSVDYTFGHDLQKIVSDMVEAEGGKVVGSSFHPLDTTDFSAYLLKAKASKANVVALNNSGQDFKSSLKQAQEFGVSQGGQRLVGLVVTIGDIDALGLDTAKGLSFVEGFYWDRTPETRAWSKKFFDRFGKMPSSIQASDYSAVMHYLKAVQAAGTKEAGAVVAKMKSMPVDDMFATGRLREDGLLVHDMYLVEVKKPAEQEYPWDYYRILRTIPGDEAYQPADPALCKILKK